MSDSSNINRVTDQKINNPTGQSKANQIIRSKVKKEILPNVLNGYRNVTYSFTISAVPDDYLDEAKYRRRDIEPKYIILKSGGKGTKDLGIPKELSKIQKSSVAAEVESANKATDDFIALANQQKTVERQTEQLKINQGIIEGFNKESPGRFDMFIDDVEIQGLMTHGSANGASLATKLSFSVVEPYSINGFIEALHAASIAAGYVTYASGAFLMTIDFWGYPDDLDVAQSTPTLIEKASKFLLFGFSSVKVEITERGTKYNCTAVMFTDRALGNPNKLKLPNSAEGKTVKEILEDLFKNISEQNLSSDNESRPGTSKIGDIYEIKFPNIDKNGKYEFTDKGNAIAASEMYDFGKANVNQAMPDPAKADQASPVNNKKKAPSAEEMKKNPNSLKYTRDGKVKIQFNSGKNLSECIESVIVNSKYVQNILQNFKPDENGLIKYFLITPNISNQDSINLQTKDYYKKYTFIVTEYRIHYTRIPGYASLKFDVNSITKLIYKEYNYTYTGKNIDVLNFRLDFNNLYFESIPFALANTEMTGVRNSVAPDNSPKVEYKTENINRVAAHEIPVQPTRTDVVPINSVVSAGQLTDNPYQILARNMHEAIINAGVSGATGTLEILGDPFFISTTGTGNYKAKIESGKVNVTVDNEIDVTFGEVYIIVIFRNPVDVNEFDKKRAPFSGVYIITQVASSFKNGVFKQDFKLLRIPAQIPLDDNMKPSDPTTVAQTSPNPNTQTVPATTPSISGPGLRVDPSLLSIPTVNNSAFALAGQAVNFAKQGISQLSAASSVFGQTQSKLSEGIRAFQTNITAPLFGLAALKSAGEQLGSAVGNQLSAANNVLTTLGNQSPSNKIVEGLPNTNNLVGGLVNKLTGGAQEQLLSNLAGDLGISPNNLFSLGKEKLNGLRENAKDLSINIPRAASSGIKLDNIPVEKLVNIPLLAPPAQAPVPDIPLQDIKGLDMARAFGVTDIKKLPGGITPDQINSVINAGSGIAGGLLSGKLPLPTDYSIISGKFGSVASQAFGALGQVSQSLESAQASLGSLNITSAANLFGSKTATSPLDKLLTPQKQQLPPSG